MKDCKLTIGIDVGSISIEYAVVGSEQDLNSIKEVLTSQLKMNPVSLKERSRLKPDCFFVSPYQRHQGQPLKMVRAFLEKVRKSFVKEHISGIWITGSGGKANAETLGIGYVNEYRAFAEGVGRLHPDVRTVFEMGGENSKYLRIFPDSHGNIQILDYESNRECAAGTGSFFDQQIERLQYSIEGVGQIIAKAEKTPSIAGRCSVFAKSDMIHAQQRGYTPPEILKGLCEAVVRNYKGTITKGKMIESRVAIVGGVAANCGIVDAFKRIFEFPDQCLVIPSTHAWMGAIGAALIGQKTNGHDQWKSRFLEGQGSESRFPTTAPLSLKKVQLLRNRTTSVSISELSDLEGFLGIDVGSVSTNLALITSEGQLLHGIYLRTDGRPIDVVRKGLSEMASYFQNRIRIKGVGTTGSGRELIGHLVGADVIKDEITAHKTGALHIASHYLNREVDTIFEIGGQDSKFISLKNGEVIDFSLNEACAAGTGSYLEEQARQLDISIQDEFAELALQSKNPLKLGERCTVFMERELGPYIQRNVHKSDIVAGLALSVVHNYLNRVVKKRKIGNVIFFQGGTAYNDAVAAAFATVLDHEIVVPPHNGIIGAIGAALLAQNHTHEQSATTFRGWNIRKIRYQLKEFTCQSCSNRCVIQEFDIEGEKNYWGDKCSDKYRKRLKTLNRATISDLLMEREKFFSLNRSGFSSVSGKGRVGIPMVLHFYDRFPFWKAYFEMLGFEIVLSGPTRKDLIHDGIEATVAEPCFPVQVAHGHLKQLSNLDVDFIFLPHVANEVDPTFGVASFICPWTQTLSLVAKHSPLIAPFRDRILEPTLYFREGIDVVCSQLFQAVKPLGIGKNKNRRAVLAANQTYNRFRKWMIDQGNEILKIFQETHERAVVILGRPYNLYDVGLNLNIPAKLRNYYGINVLPMDFLPLDQVNIHSIHDHMFWNYGRRILQASRLLRDQNNLEFIYLSNFKCGPDSYIRHYIESGAQKSGLFLQLDSHSNDAGVMTRIEAFLESKKMI